VSHATSAGFINLPFTNSVRCNASDDPIRKIVTAVVATVLTDVSSARLALISGRGLDLGGFAEN